jgi:hypothetical protein
MSSAISVPQTKVSPSIQELKEMLNTLVRKTSSDMPDLATQQECNAMVREFFLNKRST